MLNVLRGKTKRIRWAVALLAGLLLTPLVLATPASAAGSGLSPGERLNSGGSISAGGYS